jgi:hypothetical protein
MFVGWLVFPLLLGSLSLGWGALVSRLAGGGVPGALLVPAGLASIVVAAQFATLTDATAELATPLVVGGAVAGLAILWLSRKPIRPDPWAAAAAVGVFAVFAAPVVASGHATFAGYIKLDDTATWLAMTDRVMEHGRSLDGLAPSTYELTLKNYLATGYPIGSFLPLGVGGKLSGTDPAWLFQPYLAFLAAMIGLSFYSICAQVVPARPARALIAAVASQPALLFGYSLWGGVKEMAAAFALALLAALLAPVVGPERIAGGGMTLLPAAIASATVLGVLSIGGAAWLAPVLIVAVVALWAARGAFFALQRAGVFLVMTAVLALPTLVSANVFLRGRETLESNEELGNLLDPLSPLQFFGIWPAGDFRTDPTELGLTRILVFVLILAAVAGLAWAWSRRAWGLLLYVWTATAGCLIVTMIGSPWVDAKALATASPAFVLAGLVGAAAVSQRGRRTGALVLAAVIAGGVVWSNALAYHEVNLAPRDRLGELEQIGDRIAGQGPTLMTDYEPYGVRHFLRDADPEGASELRHRVVPLRSGEPLEKLGSADIDQFQTAGLLVYRTLVLRRSPVASRPPSVYRLISRGRYYEVWQQRPQTPARIVDRLPLGDRFHPDARPACGEVLRLARSAGANGELAAVRRDPGIAISLSPLAHPKSWQANADDLAILFPSGAGTLRSTARVKEAGRYGIWVGGAVRGSLELEVDGHRVAGVRHQLNHNGQFVPLGNVTLDAGPHTVTLRYEEQLLRPGSGGSPFPLGPLVLAKDTIDSPVLHVPTQRARELCGKKLDWVEALR